MCGFSVVAALDGASRTIRFPDSTCNGHSVNYISNGTAKTSAISTRQGCVTASELEKSLTKIAHRGPDSQGTWISSDGSIGLGHCRLSINDLTSSGDQPLHSPTNNLHAVVIGELYDYDRLRSLCEDAVGYQFQGTSDSELVLALYQTYGEDFVHHLRGEFSFFLYDDEKKLAFAAVDRMGIKPLFWTVVDNGDSKGKRLLLASEAKAFLPLGWQAEWNVENIMTINMIRGANTIFKGVQKIPPGRMMKLSSTGWTDSQYWDLCYRDKTEKEDRNVDDLILEVREKLRQAVFLRLRSGVPIGIYLSGGIDSSTVAGLLADIRDQATKHPNSSINPDKLKLKAFSVAFDKDSGFDESDFAQRTADHLNIPMIRCEMNEAELAANFESTTWHNEQHCTDLNTVGKYCLARTAKDHGYKVVLSGEGSDEIFGGYPWLLLDYLADQDLSVSDDQLSMNKGLRGKLHKRAREEFISAFEKSWGGNFDPKINADLLDSVGHAFTSVVTCLMGAPDIPFTSDVVENFGGMDAKIKGIIDSLPEKAAEAIHPDDGTHCILAKMSHSIEARPPFLDHHVTELVNTLPPSYKVKYDDNASAGLQYNGPWWSTHAESTSAHFREKWILREAAKPFITKEMYERRKHPYTAPTKWAVGGPIHKKLTSIVSKENVEQLGFIEWPPMEKMLRSAFGENADPGSFRGVAVVAGFVVLGQRFGIPKYKHKDQNCGREEYSELS